jgi:hypothetical protein
MLVALAQLYAESCVHEIMSMPEKILTSKWLFNLKQKDLYEPKFSTMSVRFYGIRD